MDIKQRRLIISLVALLLLFAATVTQAIELLSDDEKKASLEAFKLNASKEAKQAKRAKTSEEYISYDRQKVLDKYLDGDKYVIRLMYEKEADWPELYGEMTSFEVDRSQSFYEKTSTEIFRHYYGDNYTQLAPSLWAVTEIVAINVRIEKAEQLEKLLEDERIVSVQHLTYHYTETIYQ